MIKSEKVLVACDPALLMFREVVDGLVYNGVCLCLQHVQPQRVCVHVYVVSPWLCLFPSLSEGH